MLRFCRRISRRRRSRAPTEPRTVDFRMAPSLDWCMDDKIGQDERKKSRPRPPAAGKGRRAGSKNKISKATLPGLLAAAGARNERHEDIRAISRDILGLDSLARTGKI